MHIAVFFLDNCEVCIQPELFSKSLIFLQVSNSSKISRGKYLDEQRIQLDNRLLKNFYLNKGYYKVKIKTEL